MPVEVNAAAVPQSNVPLPGEIRTGKPDRKSAEAIVVEETSRSADTREATPRGVPQGGPLSPLLANIALDPLDKELERRGHKFARYADDFIVVVKSAEAAKRVHLAHALLRRTAATGG